MAADYGDSISMLTASMLTASMLTASMFTAYVYSASNSLTTAFMAIHPKKLQAMNLESLLRQAQDK